MFYVMYDDWREHFLPHNINKGRGRMPNDISHSDKNQHISHKSIDNVLFIHTISTRPVQFNQP